MVWVSIGGSSTTDKRSELVIMERDPESKRNGYSAILYIDALKEGLLPMCNGELFIQDNAPIHTAHVIRAWTNNNGVHYLVG